MSTQSVRVVRAAAAAMLVWACSESNGPGPVVASVTVTPDSAVIEIRDTLRFSAILKDSSGHTITGAAPRWSSSDTTRAIVATTGQVRGIAVGVSWIRAAVGTVVDSSRVTMLVPVASISVYPATVALVKGATVLISPFPRDSAGAYLFNPVTWSSSDTSKAVVVGGQPCSVGACGLVTARDSGTVTITATAGHKQATAQLQQRVLHFVGLVSAQDHTCGLLVTGEVWCWGLNSVGQLAVPYYDLPRTTPGLVRGGLNFNQITAGGSGNGGYTCGLAEAFLAYCWGENNTDGVLGSLAPTPDTIPTPVAGVHSYVMISAGSSHTCGIEFNSGTALCWGSNGAHQLGTDTLQTSAAYAPVPVAGGLTFDYLEAGGGHTCALTSAEAVWCWGANDFGQLGTDSPPPTSNYGPRPVQGGLTFVWLTVGIAHSCALTASGAAYCWGRNDYGQLGTGDTVEHHAPVPVSGGVTFQTIAAGSYNTCGISLDNKAYCWGLNDVGQLGTGVPTGNTNPHPTPAPVTGGLSLEFVESRAGETCGWTAITRIVYCWGLNVYGQLGDGSYTMSPAPVLVIGQQ